MSVLLAGPAFALPAELEAREPGRRARLGTRRGSTVGEFARGRRHRARHVCDLEDFLRPGDLLVVNDSATLPAAVDARGAGGRELALHFSTQIAGTLWIVEPRATVEAPESLELPAARVELIAPVDSGSTRLWFARVETCESVVETARTRPADSLRVRNARRPARALSDDLRARAGIGRDALGRASFFSTQRRALAPPGDRARGADPPRGRFESGSA